MQPTRIMPEVWKPVVGYEGFYEVSDHGRVRSLDRLDAMGRPIKGRELAQTTNRYGYPYVGLYRDGKSKKRMVHQLVTEAFIGPPAAGMHVDHIDNNPANNHAANLQYLTPKENTNRQALFGTSIADRAKSGEHHQQARTHCPRGHELTKPNLVVYYLKMGRRTCISCARTRAYLQKNVTLKPQFQEISDSYYADIMKQST